ncbi:LOW QUALITY PROTEIN: 40S ribosomal protein S24-like [Hippocampus zosterae]|uniref:LOW QUALITY PROTEIN: 40S ribosomal protein S24-like n=1 Tax=Hippocampus zosterae TaxID=109293 RepID=UPI00223CA0BF|nr:LOW QUALITY PROTEIN: 40S ribosomal protein S24-like [Hippocampus zosterae]
MTFTVLAKNKHVNPLLSRRELLLEVLHAVPCSPADPCPSHEKIKEAVSKKFKADPSFMSCFGFKTYFGGGRSTGFCLIYDSVKDMLKYEPNYRLRRVNILPKRQPSRKAEKELKRKIKKTRAGERRKVKNQRKKELPRHVKQAKKDYLKKLAM